MPPDRFIILSSARSGSTFLVGLLVSHPQVRCEGEIFHDVHPEKIFWADMNSGVTTPEILALRDENPGGFLEKHIYVPDKPEVTAVGFKIFYYHAQREEWQPVWSYLQNDKELRVIHLVRRNQLARLLSDKIASTTNQWFSFEENSQKPDLTVSLDAEDCLRAFEAAERQHREFAESFSGHPMLEISYEEMAGDTAAASERLTDFLHVDRRLLLTGLKKQNRRPPQEVIENYAELERFFRGGPWQDYFSGS